MQQPTNADIMRRLEELGDRLEKIESLVERASGAWLMTKWAAGALLGVAAFWNYLHEWWTTR